MSRLYLDSCIVIYLVQSESPFHKPLRAGLKQARSRGAVLFVSELTRLECRVGPKRAGNKILLEQYDRFFRMPPLGWLDFSSAVFELATDLRAAYNLKTPDALHLAAAIHHGCDAFWTNDLRLQAAAAGQLRIINPIEPIKE